MVKNQHYINEKLLNHFCYEEEKLFELLVEKKRVFPSSPQNAMSEMYVYEHESIEKNKIENNFSELEGKMIPKINNLIDYLDSDKNKIFEDLKEEIYKLIPTFLIFYYRSNALLQEYDYSDKKFRIPIMLKKILNSKYIIDLSESIIRNYSIGVLKTAGDFILSDQYISTAALKIKGEFYDLSNRHMGLRDTLILIPLTKQNYVALWHSSGKQPFVKEKINYLNERQTFYINRTIVNNSYTKCVGAVTDTLEKMSLKWKYHSPSQILIGHHDNTSSGFSKKKEVFYYEDDEKAYEILSEHVTVRDYMEASGHDKCPCRSNKQFKNCHMKYAKIVKPIYARIGTRHFLNDFTINRTRIIEKPIDAWGPMSARYDF